MNNSYLFNEKLKEERVRLKLNQAAAAEICNVSREMWGKYERGLAIPGGSVLMLLAEAGADVQYILTGTPTTRGQLKAENKAEISKGFANLSQKFAEEDDGDTSRDDEIFTMSTKATYSLNKDEWELVQLFRNASLHKKMQAVQLLTESNNQGESTAKKTVTVQGSGNKVAGRDYNENK